MQHYGAMAGQMGVSHNFHLYPLTLMLNYFRLTVLALLIAGAAAVTGCHHDSDVAPTAPTNHATPSNTSSSLLGRWELMKTVGGIAGVNTVADPTHKQEIIFDADGLTTFLLNGTATCSPSYSLVKDSTAYGYGGQLMDAITFGNFSCHPTGIFYHMLLFRPSATEMVLQEEGSDGFDYHYIRQ